MPKRIITTKVESKLGPNVISISNRKGGVEKTTLTTVMAEELVNTGYSVIMLDLDSQLDLTDIRMIFDLLTVQKILNELNIIRWQ